MKRHEHDRPPPDRSGRAPRRVALALVILVLVPTAPAGSGASPAGRARQEARWQELNAKISELYQQGKFAEAMTLAREALEVAEKTFGGEHPNVATSLNNIATLLTAEGDYPQAERTYRRALAIQEKTLKADDPALATSLNNLAAIFYYQGKYEEAEPLYRRSLAITEKALGPDHLDVADALNNLAALYAYQGRYAEAEPLHRRALEIREKAMGPDHPDVAASLNNLASLYNDQGRYAEAEPLYRRALEIREKALEPGHPDIARSLNNLAALYNDRGRYAEAEPLYRRALEIEEKALGPDHPEVSTSLSNLASLCSDQGRYEEAEPLYRRALEIREKALGPDHPDVATSLDVLAVLYDNQSRYAEAEPLLLRALAVREKALGPGHYSVGTSLSNLALLYTEQGKAGEAELFFKRGLAVYEGALGPDHPYLATALNNFARLFQGLGRYEEAEPLLRRALGIRERTLGPDHPDVAFPLNNLGMLLNAMGKYAEAGELFRRSLALLERAFGPGHPRVATALSNLASYYSGQGRDAEAEPLCRRAVEIQEKALGPDHPDVAISLNNLAEDYKNQGRYGEAEPLYRRSLGILEKALGEEHLNVAVALNNLALLHYAQGQYAKAGPLFERGLGIVRSQFDERFPYMSEKERLQFLGAVAGHFPAYYSFCSSFRDKDPGLAGRMYDAALWQKGLVVSSVAALRAKVEASGDREALALLVRLTSKRAQLAKAQQARAGDLGARRKTIAQIETEANDLEKELVRRSSALAEEKELARLTWRDIQKALKPGEAAVEVVRFAFHDGKKLTGNAVYAALVVTPESPGGPRLLSLGEARVLEGRPLREYLRIVGPDGPGTASARTSVYEAFWRPLESAFKRAKRIYFSPDGVLSQVSLAVVPRGSGRSLIDDYDLRTLASTRDLLREKRPAAPASGSAVLIGDPDFALTEAGQRAAAGALSRADGPRLATGAGRGMRSRELAGGALGPLPGTAAEIRAVGGLLEKRHWSVDVYAESGALEEAVKSVRSPRLLHIATHGFFEPGQDPEQSGGRTLRIRDREDPMLRSGLYFAGADRVLSGTPAATDLEDGVLTAYEATQMNLQGTELVVLSACETGLGKTEAGEGVFGLRRALQVAGAEAVLMSMWPVPDEETRELMALFYGKWLAGMDKPAALRKAQLEMREKVKARYGADLPLYWGAFVLVGR